MMRNRTDVWASEITRCRSSTPTAPRIGGRRRRSAVIAVISFTVSLMIPIDIYLADLRISPYRIVLLLYFVPSALTILQNNETQFRLADLFILLYVIFGSTSLLINGANVSSVGVFILESLGPYLLARAFIQSTSEFVFAARTLLLCILFSIGFAFYENITGDAIILSTLAEFVPTLPNVQHEVRLGLDRAQVVFDHPILYGIFCAFAFPLAFYVAGTNNFTHKNSTLKASLVAIASFTSLSSGALVAVGLQSALIAWDLATRSIRNRWIWLLTGLGVVGTALELASNRTLAEISINYIALNAHNAWIRLAVNGYVLENIYANFWWGIGLHGDWERPAWMTGSVDNFWLATTLRYGVPTSIFLLGAALAAFLSVARAVNLNPRVEACRTGLIISVAGVSVAIITVHLWNSTYCYFIFLLASGLWIPNFANVISTDSQLTSGSQPFGSRRRPRIRALLAGEAKPDTVASESSQLRNSRSGENNLKSII